MSQVANFYSELWRYHPPVTDSVDKFLRKVGLDKKWFNGKKCLDAGCGWGKNLVPLSKLSNDVTAVDLCDLTFAKKLTKGSKIKFKRADLRNLPYKNGTFDFIICEGVLHHVYEYEKLFNELKRVLKKNGVLVVCVRGRGGISPFMYLSLRKLIPDYFKKVFLLMKDLRGAIIYDTITVPVQLHFSEKQVRSWFSDFKDVQRMGFDEYDYKKFHNRIIHGDGWIIMKGTKN